MKYSIEVTSTAKQEAGEAFAWLSERAPYEADEWFHGLVDAMAGLSEFPNRWPLAREDDALGQEIRQLLYGKRPHIYRVLFIVRKSTVHVLHVRHGARAALAPDEITFPGE
jgi:plasmid stabilization system protein ParE